MCILSFIQYLLAITLLGYTVNLIPERTVSRKLIDTWEVCKGISCLLVEKVPARWTVTDAYLSAVECIVRTKCYLLWYCTCPASPSLQEIFVYCSVLEQNAPNYQWFLFRKTWGICLVVTWLRSSPDHRANYMLFSGRRLAHNKGSRNPVLYVGVALTIHQAIVYTCTGYFSEWNESIRH